MHVLRPWLVIGLLTLICGWLFSLWLIEPARVNFVLPSSDGKNALRWSCTQPTTIAEAEARAKDAHRLLEAALGESVKSSMDEFKQALASSEPDAVITNNLQVIDNKIMDQIYAAARQLDASHGCRPYLG